MSNGQGPHQVPPTAPAGAVLQGGAGLPLLRAEGLCKHYPGVDALVDVDFELAPGEVHVLFGENGAGKSTLISILAGANQPTRGQLYANGEPVVFANVRDGMHLRVIEVVAAE